MHSPVTSPGTVCMNKQSITHASPLSLNLTANLKTSPASDSLSGSWIRQINKIYLFRCDQLHLLFTKINNSHCTTIWFEPGINPHIFTRATTLSRVDTYRRTRITPYRNNMVRAAAKIQCNAKMQFHTFVSLKSQTIAIFQRLASNVHTNYII